ncbi:amidase family protein [Nocardioides houyundeii]|uniref:amidase family protein n=1 Tax=Nocardioides houyundeii TaxID=2045452 RepID=UPI0013B43F5A|nr:amidase family protein [Nocardioides houyundeii]
MHDPTLMVSEENPLGAWMPYGRVRVEGASDGPLQGLEFAAKDNFAVAGVPTSMGNALLLEQNDVPTTTDPLVEACLNAGGTLVGKAHMDEFGWSISGVNRHFGTPVNPAAPDRIPGGSSSGPVSLVSAGVVPFALGGDGGGSARTPASYTGILGIRATYGRPIEEDPSSPKMTSSGVHGWFARDADLFLTLGSILLHDWHPAPAPGQAFFAEDLWAVCDDGVLDACGNGLAAIESVLGAATPISLAQGELPAWRDAFNHIHNAEFWASMGKWYETNNPLLGEDIASRFEIAQQQAPEVADAAWALRHHIRKRMWGLLADNAIIVAPSAVGPAPLRNASFDELEVRRRAAFQLMCPAGHAQLCQVSLPLATVDGAPVGISLIAAPGNDELLLEVTRDVMRAAAL